MYQLEVCQSSSVSACNCQRGVVHRAYLPLGSNSIMVTGLHPYTSYRIRVRANSTSFPDFGSCLNGQQCPWRFAVRLHPRLPRRARQRARGG